MAFVCTISGEDFRTEIFANGSSRICVLNVGYDDTSNRGYTVVVGLEPVPGGDFEFFFHLIEVDGETGTEYIHWSGKDVGGFIPKEGRSEILRAILALTGHLLTEMKPEKVSCCTHEQYPPEQALVKHFLIGNVFEECGYVVHTADPYHGKRVWWMERKPSVPVAPERAST